VILRTVLRNWFSIQQKPFASRTPGDPQELRDPLMPTWMPGSTRPGVTQEVIVPLLVGPANRTVAFDGPWLLML